MGNHKILEIRKLIYGHLENILFYVESIPDMQDMPLKHYLIIKSLLTEPDADWDNLIDKITALLEDDG